MTRIRSWRGSLREAADQYLSECFAGETPPHVNEFARRIGVSPRALGRAFMADAGTSAGVYFKRARIERAQELLASTELPLDAIAHRAGFGTRATMFRSFKRAVGLTPDEYRIARAPKM